MPRYPASPSPAHPSGYFDGFGRRKWVNGDLYEGIWQADKKHGQGTFQLAGGDVYEVPLPL